MFFADVSQEANKLILYIRDLSYTKTNNMNDGSRFLC